MLRTLSILAVAALALAAAPAAAPRQAYLSDCGTLIQHPPQLVLACADANYGLAKLSWSNWGGVVARGTGTARANDCTPYCAAGHFHSYRAVVVASRPVLCAAKRVYLRLEVHYPAARPKGYPKLDVHTWTCAQARASA